MAKELKDQPKWNDQGLPDLRHLDDNQKLDPPEMIKAGESEEEAYEIICTALGLKNQKEIKTSSRIGEITIKEDNVRHIVEKRADARERYTAFALKTIEEPYEIWEVEYDNNAKRFAFIGAYKGKYQMLVIVDIQDDKVLWNFMHSDAKSLNKHRHGTIIYQK